MTPDTLSDLRNFLKSDSVNVSGVNTTEKYEISCQQPLVIAFIAQHTRKQITYQFILFLPVYG